jgi:hypothetical protein
MNIKKIIREELDDWDWTRGPIWMDKVNVGDRIRIHNRGKEEAFLNWLGDYKYRYLLGEYGEDITGVVSKVYPEEFVLEIGEDTIFFPYKERVEVIVSTNSEYNGLDLEYEFIPKSI